MNWDWEKLQEKRQRQSGSGSNWGAKPPEGKNSDPLGDGLKKLQGINFPAGKFAIALVIILWLVSGIYIVQPDEEGVVLRFGKYVATTSPGPHYHLPYPIETVYKPKVSQIRRIEVGFRSTGKSTSFQQGQSRSVKAESLMLTGDENIVDVQFIVQYRISNAVNYLFNVTQQGWTVKSAAEAAMREIIGHNKIDNALTEGKLQIQNDTRMLLQDILDRYEAGIQIVAVQIQDVHPPQEVVDAFKDVASAREDRSRIINEAEAYSNDILPKARGAAAEIVNKAQAYKESTVNKSQGDAARFLAILAEYNQAKSVTKKRMYLEAMENVFSSAGVEKIIVPENGVAPTIPFLPLSDNGKKGDK
ncbi:MAG: FtsH protease activity modulator HflK [Desulfovibrionales bacterium]|nr:FtsH protease activity modulator HflK [Desulfovibrionales bacterium]